MKTVSYASGRQNPVVFYRNLGVSPDAEKIREESDVLKESFARTISFGGKLSQILEELLGARQEYSKDNWDGYGAKSIDEHSYENALRFALSLPSSIPSPEVDVVPSGQVVFTWSEGKRQLFSVIIGRMNELSYAGLFGATNTYGVEYFADGVPETILDNINKVYS